MVTLHTFQSFNKWPETGVKFVKLLRCKLKRGPKWRCFRKHLASLHQNIKKWQKTGGNFWKLLQQTNCCINKCPGRVHLDLLPHCTPLHRHNKPFHFFPRDKILYPSEIMKKTFVECDDLITFTDVCICEWLAIHPVRQMGQEQLYLLKKLNHIFCVNWQTMIFAKNRIYPFSLLTNWINAICK